MSLQTKRPELKTFFDHFNSQSDGKTSRSAIRMHAQAEMANNNYRGVA